MCLFCFFVVGVVYVSNSYSYLHNWESTTRIQEPTSHPSESRTRLRRYKITIYKAKARAFTI